MKTKSQKNLLCLVSNISKTDGIQIYQLLTLFLGFGRCMRIWLFCKIFKKAIYGHKMLEIQIYQPSWLLLTFEGSEYFVYFLRLYQRQIVGTKCYSALRQTFLEQSSSNLSNSMPFSKLQVILDISITYWNICKCNITSKLLKQPDFKFINFQVFSCSSIFCLLRNVDKSSLWVRIPKIIR